MKGIEFYYIKPGYYSIEIDGEYTGFYFSHPAAGKASCYEAKPNGRVLKLDKTTYFRYTAFDGSSGLEDELLKKFRDLDNWTVQASCDEAKPNGRLLKLDKTT